jgi:EAL domain-containing protein (putative c-di-GMP-specific phosphodiesterase class I)/DNA-binding NarL/FixJ family response regulator
MTPRSRSVLVVDDDEDLRFMIRHWLAASARFHVVGEADTGADAVEVARQVQPDLAIVDVNLPNGDGEEATRLMGSVSPATKVLAYSASFDRDFMLAMVAAGADGYVVKSGHVQELLDALDTIAAGEIYIAGTFRNHLVEQLRTSMRNDRARNLPASRDHQIVDQAMQPGNLQIAFQPIVDLRSDAVVGHEALARFSHVDGPAAVFSAAARVGRRSPIEIQAACQALEIAAGSDLPGGFLSINASPDVGIITRLGYVVAAASTRPTDIVIELTEQAAVEDYPAVTRALAPLRRDGVRLAVDDVGGGFACLTHVHQLLPDILKIDRYLVAGIQHDRTRRSMVSALVRIAEDTGASVIAEGIELPAERECVEELGIRLGQGFLLGRPVVAPPGHHTKATRR